MTEIKSLMENNSEADRAISIWEKGVLKEKDGSMSDAINFYRKAIKVYEDVEKLYRKKLHDEWILHKNMKELTVDEREQEMEEDDASDKINEDITILPCWLLEMLPNDILLKIVQDVVLLSGESWVNLSLSCKKFNTLCFHNRAPYETFKNFIYPKQNYDQYAMDLNGISNLSVFEREIWGDDCQKMVSDRPFIKFQGTYISVVNYLRYGSHAEGTSSFLNPVHMITYYRYFRFYPDGKVLRLLTTDEPSTVVKHFSRDSKPKGSELCSWSLGFEDNFGRVTIKRSNDKYSFCETLQIKNQGNKKHQRLKWVSSVIENLEGDISECSLKNEKPFFFSRVKSYASS